MAAGSLEATPKRQDWWRWAVVIGIAVLGIDLALHKPLWLPPPSFASTPLIYMALAVLWIPAGFILQPNRYLNKGSLATIIVIVLTLGSIATLFVQNWYVFLTDGSFGHKCTSEVRTDGQIRYNCTLNDFSGDTFEFVGPQNGMFVQLVRSGSK